MLPKYSEDALFEGIHFFSLCNIEILLDLLLLRYSVNSLRNEELILFISRDSFPTNEINTLIAVL